MPIAARLFATTAIALGLTAGLSAQPATEIDDLDVERINASQIKIEFEYDGSACEEVGPAELGALTDGVLAVTFRTIATAEICTQQIVEIDVEQVVEADASVTHVEVTLLATDGSVRAVDTEDVEED